MFKKTAVAALILGVSGIANAAMYARCESGNVTVPCEGAAWDVGIDALYVRNTDSTLNLGGVSQNDNADAEYGWGFRLEGSYHWGTGNDFNVNWSHFSKTTDRLIAFAGDGDGVVDDNASLDSKFDIVNFELAQHIDVGENWDIRMHGGLQYASVKNNLLVTDTAAATHTFDRKLQGFGPRIGMDVSYGFGNGFAVFANAAMAILNADIEDSNVTGAVFNFGQASFDQTVTHFDKRIGVMYTHGMEQGDLTIRGGYQSNNFNNGNFFVDNSLDGWFIGAKWVGNA